MVSHPGRKSVLGLELVLVWVWPVVLGIHRWFLAVSENPGRFPSAHCCIELWDNIHRPSSPVCSQGEDWWYLHICKIINEWMDDSQSYVLFKSISVTSALEADRVNKFLQIQDNINTGMSLQANNGNSFCSYFHLIIYNVSMYNIMNKTWSFWKSILDCV